MSDVPSDINRDKKTEKFVVRLPHGMRALIAEAATDNHRSMNSEIVALLEHQLGRGTPAPGSATANGSNHEHYVTVVLSESEMELVRRFRALSEAKRHGLKALLN